MREDLFQVEGNIGVAVEMDGIDQPVVVNAVSLFKINSHFDVVCGFVPIEEVKAADPRKDGSKGSERKDNPHAGGQITEIVDNEQRQKPDR